MGGLFDPGDTPHENAQFLVFCAAVIRAVHRHGALLRATVATASNDHRLGAHEAPPAIVSIYLGDNLTSVFEQIKKGKVEGSKQKSIMNVGVDTLPPLPIDPGDRNRTSPFAFTGNRFEFRAVGSSMSVAGPLVALNTMVAESLDYMATELEAATGGDSSKLNAAVQTLLQKVITEHGSVIFNGDGYSVRWQEEAARRGLPNLRTTPEALPAISSPASVELFARYNVLSANELFSREEIYTEQYCKTIETEANLMLRIAKTIIFPAAVRYQNELAQACANLKAIGKEYGTTTLDQLTANLRAMQKVTYELQALMEGDKGVDSQAQARFYCHTILPAMREVRKHSDLLETIIADDLWELPSYQEMLFIR